MSSRIALAAAVALSILVASGCGAPAVAFSIRTEPPGAAVYLSRRGERSYRGASGPIRSFEESFMLIGRTPVDFISPLEEQETAFLRIGVTRVRRYEHGVLRFEKRGYQSVERHVPLEDGKIFVDVELRRVASPRPQSGDELAE